MIMILGKEMIFIYITSALSEKCITSCSCFYNVWQPVTVVSIRLQYTMPQLARSVITVQHTGSDLITTVPPVLQKFMPKIHFKCKLNCIFGIYKNGW